MGRTLRSGLLLASLCTLTSCHTPSTQISGPQLREPKFFYLSEFSDGVQIRLKGTGECYHINRRLADIAQKRMDQDDRDVFYNTDFVVRAAPLADVNKDHKIDFFDLAYYTFRKDKSNELIGLMNFYLPIDAPKFKKR